MTADWFFTVLTVVSLVAFAGLVVERNERLCQSRRENRRLSAKVAELESIADELSDARHAAAGAQGVSDLLWWVK